MSAPITSNQMVFELPKLSYIDTRWEEPAVQPAAAPVHATGWLAGFRAWRARERAMAELQGMTDRELFDVGLNRGDFDRVFNKRFNQDLLRSQQLS